MAYWLLKTEPEEFSWDDQVKKGAKGETWSGVRNFTARRHLKEMKKGEKFFFYHTGDEKQVVGIGEVIKEAYADPTAAQGEPWVAVTTQAHGQPGVGQVPTMALFSKPAVSVRQQARVVVPRI